jgi:NAD(P)-dependent dehydrogenase (short-subunit alcohol dehydrogenase family)
MGRALVRAALVHNDRVCAVGQSHSIDTLESMRSLHLAHVAGPSPQETSSQEQNYIPLLCDVRVRSTVSAVFKTALSHFGSVDIITNCSGHGIIGACEDQSEADIRNQFETNFMGTLNIIQLSLPYFREQQGGRYVIFSSTSGALGVPGLGPYCATKYAVEGLIESMLYEVDGFGIKATLVVGGHMRRDELEAEAEKRKGTVTHTHRRSHTKTDSGSSGLPDTHLRPFQHFHIKPASAPYAGLTSPAGHFPRMLQWIGDNQPTSAIQSAELIWQLGHCSFPPLRLLLGGYAVESIRDRLRSIIEEIEDWKHLSFAAVEVETEMSRGAKGQQADGVADPGGEEMDGHEDTREDGEETVSGM